MSDDLIAFLRARLDWDEQDLAPIASWAAQLHDSTQARLWHMGGASAVMSAQRAMREIEAKRRVLDECVRTLDYEDHGHWLAEHVIQGLAAVYAGHPHYRPEWRPGAE